MNILILSFYFSPDLSAGSFRASALVDELKRMKPNDARIHVFTTFPNRYNSFFTEAQRLEDSPGLSIVRIDLPPHHSGMFDQARAFISFAREVRIRTRGQKYDLVFATSSRLMTAVLGALVARNVGAPLYLDIRDIFVDTINDVLPKYLNFFIKPLFSSLEYWAVNSAEKVNLVSSGFSEYFKTRYPLKSFSYFTNGIDDDFLSMPIRESRPREDAIIDVLYAGNLGEGQGLHAIIPALARRMRGRIRFNIIGDGGRKEALCVALAKAGVDNVKLLPPMSRAQLVMAYKAADVLFLHLNDYEAFKKVLPSKLFEYGAMGKPIWAGVAGYAAEFVRGELANAVVFRPCDAVDAERVFSQLRIHEEYRDGFINKFARKNIVHKFASDILSTIG
ncbi:glycosyltransferase family 4 protein [Candidatus Nomurabacteria bacterium]|nr:glycosyltransferase family 4 protein [Candidatus Nomurabacteria bacterium]